MGHPPRSHQTPRRSRRVRRHHAVPDQIERDIFIAAPIQKVWSVLTAAEHMGRGTPNGEADVDLRPGGAITLRWADLGTMLFRDERVEPPRFFSFRWARPTDAEPVSGNSTLVEFTLTPEGTATHLHVVESGIHSLAQPDPAKPTYFDDNTQGWISQLEEIRTYAETPAA